MDNDLGLQLYKIFIFSRIFNGPLPENDALSGRGPFFVASRRACLVCCQGLVRVGPSFFVCLKARAFRVLTHGDYRFWDSAGSAGLLCHHEMLCKYVS